MIVRTYCRDATQELVITVVADNDATPSWAQPVGTGGGWQVDTWRDDLVQALMDRLPLVAVGMRTASTDRVLSDQTWTDIAYRLARHPGVLDGDRPWVAMRTGDQAIVFLAQTDRGPAIGALVEFPRDIEHRYDLTARRPIAHAFQPPGAPDTAIGAQPANPTAERPSAPRHAREPHR